jgi:glycerol kinase
MTALGAAKLAALGVGLIDRLDIAPAETPSVWTPRMDAATRTRLLAGWKAAIRATLAAAEPTSSQTDRP